MSYQVLARKWRPQNFQEMAGQEHVLKALTNALDQDRLHHAYLFTGTRGVGKTTVARIFAKSLNCESGVTSNPCGKCGACQEIAEGRFVDLIEIDAASRTKVEDMRELLDNAQYAPTCSRYKIYLIDEVHMLSNSSFNALLKTLEEPPPHIKFLLATTDPQKLPVTVLSRCLQFNLKNLSPERIVKHLDFVLQAENIATEENALWELAKAADGSMRDALSLADQAIAFGNGAITGKNVLEMLGTIEKHIVLELLQTISRNDARQVFAKVKHMAEYSPDYAFILQAMAELLHRVAIEQLLPGAIDNSFGDQQQVVALAQEMTAEDAQLYYQISLTSRKDLSLAPDPRVGFEMALLRMLSFRPNIKSAREINSSPAANPKEAAGEEGESRSNPQTESRSLKTVSNHQEVKISAPPDGLVSAPPEIELPPLEAYAKQMVDSEPHSGSVDDRSVGTDPVPEAPSRKTDHPTVQAATYRRPSTEENQTNVVPLRQPKDSPGPEEPPVSSPAPLPSPPSLLVTESAKETKGAKILQTESEQTENQQTEPDEIDDTGEALVAANPNFDVNQLGKHGNDHVDDEPLLKNQHWAEVIRQLRLKGMTHSIAQRCVLQEVLGQRIEFVIDKDHYDFFNELQQNRLTDALSEFVGEKVKIVAKPGESKWLSPLQEIENCRAELQAKAEQEIQTDPNVLNLIGRFDAFIVNGSIEPVIADV